ncbi:hypothetical protein GCM10010387_15820 [Streptomyces inusitatus]|uniref:Uncharacterized protein n=1 Tax=Streptomyces inusitatus TaxID=68221 RepID=A0A918PUP5_9ACTN|nr:hypothetical protein [Streptomyces inusitatus]GGZ23473.1 hypothetical protein GCM10010387_15820 [Streptomyces inusitatus]
MTTQPPTRPAYPLPDSGTLSVAAQTALNASHQAAYRLGRVMAVVAAAAVRDILTGHDHEAAFDAAGVELTETADGSLQATGWYWTAAGEQHTFAEAIGEREASWSVSGMNEWTSYLDDSNRDVWHPLCTEALDRDGCPAYRLDLAKAAALPID